METFVPEIGQKYYFLSFKKMEDHPDTKQGKLQMVVSSGIRDEHTTILTGMWETSEKADEARLAIRKILGHKD